MIIIALRETDDGMVATVNCIDTTGSEPATIDVTENYHVKELLVTDEDGTTRAGWFISKNCDLAEMEKA